MLTRLLKSQHSEVLAGAHNICVGTFTILRVVTLHAGNTARYKDELSKRDKCIEAQQRALIQSETLRTEAEHALHETMKELRRWKCQCTSLRTQTTPTDGFKDGVQNLVDELSSAVQHHSQIS